MDRDEAPQTKEQKYKARQWNRMFVERDLIVSKAFLDLKTAAACQVLMIFLSKRQWEPTQGKAKRKDGYVLANQGQIQFTYREARQKYGMSASKFRTAIDELVRVGFIDIAHSGYGLQKDVSLYAISDRWRKFGTDEFDDRHRPKRAQRMGFKKGNRHGRYCRTEKDVDVADNSWARVVDNSCTVGAV